MVYFFLFITLKNILSLVFSFEIGELVNSWFRFFDVTNRLEIRWKVKPVYKTVCKFCLPLAAWSARHFRSGWYGFGIRFAQVSLAVLLLSPVGNILAEISMIFQICEYLWHFLFSLWQKSKFFVFVNRWQLSRAHNLSL